MNDVLIDNAHIYTPAGVIQKGWILSRDGKIDAMGGGAAPSSQAFTRIDGRGMRLLPGFIDIHIHGAKGYDVMDASPEALRGIAAYLAQHGVTRFLPTTLTDAQDRLLAAVEAIRALTDVDTGGARILGAHIEGPYLNIEKAGAQNPEYIRLADQGEIDALLASGVVRLIDIAPEFPENRALIPYLTARGVKVSIAHSSATYEQVHEAVALGLSHATHTYNAQTGLNHRAPGIVGAVLTLPEIDCEIIADTVHVHQAAVNILYRCKGAHRTILISDSVRPAGMPNGEYRFDQRAVILKDGIVRLPDGTLAGSALALDTGLRNLMATTGESLDILWRTSSLNAARAVGVSARMGSIEVGKDADFVLLDDAMTVQMTVVEGEIVYRA